MDNATEVIGAARHAIRLAPLCDHPVYRFAGIGRAKPQAGASPLKALVQACGLFGIPCAWSWSPEGATVMWELTPGGAFALEQHFDLAGRPRTIPSVADWRSSL